MPSHRILSMTVDTHHASREAPADDLAPSMAACAAWAMGRTTLDARRWSSPAPAVETRASGCSESETESTETRAGEPCSKNISCLRDMAHGATRGARHAVPPLCTLICTLGAATIRGRLYYPTGSTFTSVLSVSLVITRHHSSLFSVHTRHCSNKCTNVCSLSEYSVSLPERPRVERGLSTEIQSASSSRVCVRVLTPQASRGAGVHAAMASSVAASSTGTPLTSGASFSELG